MNAFAEAQLPHASRLVSHGPTVLVTSAHGGRRNVMAAAWSMPVEFAPPRILGGGRFVRAGGVLRAMPPA